MNLTLAQFREVCPRSAALFGSYSSLTQAVHRYGITHVGSGGAQGRHYLGYPMHEWRVVIAMRLMSRGFGDLAGVRTGSHAMHGMRPLIAAAVADGMPPQVVVVTDLLTITLLVPDDIAHELNAISTTTGASQ